MVIQMGKDVKSMSTKKKKDSGCIVTVTCMVQMQQDVNQSVWLH
jgi:hypothetical protein